MKRIRTILIVFIILIAQNAIAEGVFESAPGWLKGVLSIDLFGADSLEESWPLDRYVCVFDFDASRIDKVKIPSGAAYTKEWQSGGRCEVRRRIPSERDSYRCEHCRDSR